MPYPKKLLAELLTMVGKGMAKDDIYGFLNEGKMAEPAIVIDDSPWKNWSCPTCERTWQGSRPRSHLCPDGTIYVSASTLAAKQSCDLQAWLRGQGASIAQDNVPATAGQAYHIAMAHYYRQGDAEQAQAVFQEEYQAFADTHVDPNGPLARLTYENTSVIVAEWFARYRLDEDYVLWSQGAEKNALFRVNPDLVEVPFQLTLSEEHQIVVIGILDALVEEYHTGQWLVKDHKTTGDINKRWWQKFQLDAQPSTYAWAGQEQAEKPVMGVLINGVQFDKLPGEDPNRKCYIHKVKYAECRNSHAKIEMVQFDRSPLAIEKWKRNAIKAARELRQLLLAYPELGQVDKLEVNGRFNGSCLNCFAAPFCAGDQQTPVAQAFTITEGMVGE